MTDVKRGINVIFLDIDGVLNNRKRKCLLFECDPKDYNLDRKNLSNLDDILCYTDNCKIVINSSWRNYPDDWTFENQYGDVYYSLLPQLRNRYVDYIIGNSPHVEGRNKCGDVLDYINNYSDSKTYIKNFAILDDDPFQGLDYFKEFFFKTTKQLGLTKEISDKIIEHFTDEG